MKKFTQLFITVLVFITAGAWSVSAWGYYKSNVYVNSSPSTGGYVYVGTDNTCNANSCGTKTTDNASKQGGGRLSTSGNNTLYLCNNPKQGYVFKGWAKKDKSNSEESSNSGDGVNDNPYAVTVSGSASIGGGTDHYYYAIFARMAANTPAAGDVSFGDVNVGSESGWKQIKIDHAHAGTVSISQKGNDADFFVGATTGATTELSSFESTTETTRTLYVKFVPQNNGLRTCTLTVSSNNGLSSLTYYLSGTGYNEPSITWVDGNGSELVSGETTLSAGDILRAICETGQTISYSDFNASYFETGSDANGNYIKVKENISGTIDGVSVTANLAKDNVNYNAAHSETFTLNITNLTPQEIVWDDDISDLSNENMPYTITLSAYAKNAKTGDATGLPVTYSMPTNASMSLSGNVLTVKALGGPFTITASVDGNEDYAPASARKNATVINMTDPCGTSDSHNGATLDKNSKSLVIYPTVPDKLTFRLSKSSSAFILNNIEVREFNANNTKIATTTYSHYDIKTSGDNYSINCQPTTTKIEFYSDAYMSYSCTVSNIVTTRKTTTTVSTNALEYEVSKGQSLGKDVTITYSNVPVFLTFKSDEDANKTGTSLWSLSVSKFGGCGKKGSQTVRVTFHSNSKGDYSDKLYVRNNVGDLLQTINLSASVTAQTQFLDEGQWNIQDTYSTTDQTTLSATTRAGHTDFTFTVKEANPAGCATITDGVMTFNASGTATIQAALPEIGIYEAFTATHDITINKATPDIAENPSGTSVVYRQTLNKSTLTGGAADITLHGAAHTGVAGSFAWTEPTHVVTDAAGSHSYEVTFTPTDGGMYTTNTCSVAITVKKAAQALTMNDGTVKVAVSEGIDAGADNSELDLDDLINSDATTADVVNAVKRDGAVTYEVISGNKNNAKIAVGNIFSATVIGEYTIRATKAQTDYYNETTDEFTVTVEKRANTLATAGPYTKYVDDEVGTVATTINSNGTIHTSSSDATVAYYNIVNNKIVIPNSEAKSFDQKEVTIKIWQEATTCFEGIAEADAKIIVVTVKKYDNNFSCSWGSWTKQVNFEDVFDVEFTTNNEDYTHSQIQITQISGATVATLVKNDDTHCTITASYTRADATWNLYQAENYKYKAATKTGVKVEVRVLPAVCYLYEDNTEHTFSTSGTDISGHFDNAVAINGPVKQISFDAKRDFAGVDNFVVQYSVDNGANWRDISMPGISTSYVTYGPYDFTGLQANEKVTHIRFGAKTGATLGKYYKNVKVSRATSIKPEDENGNLIETLTMPQNTIDGTTTAKFYMNYSSCDDVIKIVSNNAHFTVDQPTITVDHSKGYNRAEVTVSYTADAKGTHTGTITLYTKYQNRTFTVTGTTDKKVQTLDWQPGFEGDPMTLSVGLTVDNVNKAAVANSERSVVYSTDNAEVIKITLGGLGFEVIGTGTATLTAAVAEDDYWFPVSESKTVNATNKKIQVIVWDQDLMRGLKLDDVIDLDAKVFIRNMSDGTLTEDATRTPYITYSCEANSVISLDTENKQITVTGYGNATIIAYVAGDGTTYEVAQPVTMYVKVRQPSAGCESPLVLNHADNVQLFSMDMQLSGSFSEWTTPEITSEIIELNPANGKPDKLSYQHNGELYVKGLIKLCRGTVMAQQRVNGQWSDIEGSTYNNGGKEGSEGAYDWRLVEDLQLDENADAIRFRRLNAGQGYHNFKDIKITLKHYLRPTVEEVDLADIEMGESRSATIGFDYSDVKGDLAATKGSEDATYVINETLMEMECGAHGHYDLPITITPTAIGPWSTTIIIEDQFTHETTTLLVKANVIEGVKYIFNGGEGEAGMIWSEDTNWGENQQPDAGAAVIVNSDVIITGEVTVGSLTISDQTTVTVAVTGTLNLGDGSSALQENYGNLHIEEGGKVNVGSGALLVNDFILDAKLGDGTTKAASGQLRDEQDKLVVLKKANFDLTFDPGDRITYGWYDFTVPFPVNINGGIKRVKGAGLEPMVCGRDFLIMEDDEASFVNGGKGWHKLNSGVLQPGKLYTITFDDEVDQNTFRFIWNGQGDLTNGESFAAEYLTGSDESRNGWNAIGNGMLRHGYIGGGYKIQAYNHTDNVYELVSGNKTFAVGTAFFVQVSTAGNINWTAAEASDHRPLYAPQRETREIEEFRLSLSNEATGLANDVLFFSASDEATEAYVIGHDLLKRGTPTEAKKAQMWATKGGKTLCDVESQLVGTKASAPLSLFTPEDGTFELAVEEAPEDASLFLTYNDRAIWNLSMSPYLFDLSKGTTEGYGLRIIADRQTTTDIENGEAVEGENGVRKVLIDNVLYLITPDGKMYDVVGKGVKF